jgi:enoyl-CoA hydratase/carnithine racemase
MTTLQKLEHPSVNYVVPANQVLEKAISVARQVCENSPDAVQSAKRGLLLAKENNHQDAVLAHIWSPETRQLHRGENIVVRD